MYQSIDYEGKRIETGALRIGGDWTGLFVRGDDCLGKLRFILNDWLMNGSQVDPSIVGFVRFLIAEIEDNVKETE